MPRRPPPLVVAQVKLTCPDGQRVVDIPGPTAALALRKLDKFVPPARCKATGAALVQRGAGSITLRGAAARNPFCVEIRRDARRGWEAVGCHRTRAKAVKAARKIRTRFGYKLVRVR